MYITCTWFVQCTYRSGSKTSLDILVQASSFSDQFESSLYWERTLCISTLDWKRWCPSSIFQINQSIHSNHYPFPCPLQEGPLAAAGGSAGCASAPAALAALASAAARPRRPHLPPLQRSTLLLNWRSVGRTSPTVLTIYCAAMDLLWSRMCCGDLDVATKIGYTRYDFFAILCSNNQQLLKHNDMKLCGNVSHCKMICFNRTCRCGITLCSFWLIIQFDCLSWGLRAWKIQ